MRKARIQQSFIKAGQQLVFVKEGQQGGVRQGGAARRGGVWQGRAATSTSYTSVFLVSD
jgi:hypothetical protein